MIVGGYSLDLYCENRNDKNHTFDEHGHYGNSQTRGECFEQARKDGHELKSGVQMGNIGARECRIEWEDVPIVIEGEEDEI